MRFLNLILLIISFVIYIILYIYFKILFNIHSNKNIKIFKITNLKILNNTYPETINQLMIKYEHQNKEYYPYGNDYFSIDHGDNYFSFFERLGKIDLTYCLDKSSNSVVGSFIKVKRKTGNDNVSYMCDLKVDKRFRNINLGTNLVLKNVFLDHFFEKMYAISMDDSTNPISIIEKKIKKYQWLLPIVELKFQKLLIYSLNYQEIIQILPKLEEKLGKIRYISLEGKKDLILKSNNQKIKLFHLDWGFCNHSYPVREPLEDYQYMFCFLENNPIVKELDNLGISTNITAKLIHNCPDDFSFNFIRTSDL